MFNAQLPRTVLVNGMDPQGRVRFSLALADLSVCGCFSFLWFIMLRMPQKTELREQIHKYEQALFDLNELLKNPSFTASRKHALKLQQLQRRQELRTLKASLAALDNLGAEAPD